MKVPVASKEKRFLSLFATTLFSSSRLIGNWFLAQAANSSSTGTQPPGASLMPRRSG